MDNIGREFMEFTKYQYLGESDQARGKPQPPLEAEYDLTAVKIGLPPPDGHSCRKATLADVILNRRSLRRYLPVALTAEELSFLLWSTQGVKEAKSGTVTFRTVPSAGARHALETYLLINRVDGFRPGLYRYLALEHRLIEFNMEPDIAEKLTACCLGQGMVGMSAATFLWVAVVDRMSWRYDTRGYRYLHLDAGHVCQNLYLAAEAIQGGACAIGAYDDDEINCLLGLDGEEQFVIYAATTGKK